MVWEGERLRLQAMKKYENELYAKGIRFVAGTDEAGRGPIAGPVVAAAVVLPPDFELAGVNDSKQLSAKKRELLCDKIKEEALTWAVGMVFPQHLDRINVLNAAREAMRMALRELALVPEHVIVDGWPIPGLSIAQTPLVKGDALSISVACASILAKVERDRIMQALDDMFPGYGFARHKGYLTREHLQALAQKGPCRIHRMSFEPVKSMVRKDNVYQGQLFE